MKLYENVVIGNFLYGLGCEIGGRLRTGTLPGAVNLLQQTPEDKALGDVLLSYPGTLRLLEFKVAANYSKKEKIKRDKLAKAVEARRGMGEVSRQVHWYIETAVSDASGVEAFFGPYLDALDAARAARPRSSLGLRDFIGTLVDDVFLHRDGEVPQAVSDYLKLVRWCQGEGEAGASGLIVVVGAGGKLTYVELKDMMELRMNNKQWLAYRRTLEVAADVEHSLERRGSPKRLDRSHERSR
ncbi:hypothetical protein [Coralloluteibacterium thermophilus]|uniref:Uncharacterized protein n=1 Tax=Coralloluteibacterium thermophilum TaxID=2707049 RepID=A0ABV9NQP3_9GAMM